MTRPKTSVLCAPELKHNIHSRTTVPPNLRQNCMDVKAYLSCLAAN
jgi:hypothetical protein